MLAEKFPDIAREWDAEKNGVRAEMVWVQETELAWWRCVANPDHVWQQSVKNRIVGVGCAECRFWNVSLALLYPDIARQWHPILNGDATPRNVAAKSGKKVWWQCPKDSDHVYQQYVDLVTSGVAGCSICSGHQVIQKTSLEAKRADLAEQWHPTKNEKHPSEVSPSSHHKVWWRCLTNPRHEWQAAVYTRSGGSGCPFCNRRYVHETNNLAVCAPQIAAEWHPTKNRVIRTDNSRGTFLTFGNDAIPPNVLEKNNGKRLKPQHVMPGSDESVWWRCAAKGHEYEMVVRHRVMDGYGCPVCSGQRVVAGSNSLADEYPAVAKRWHSSRNGKLQPTQLRPGSNTRVWWTCPRSAEHVWQAAVKEFVRAHKNGNSGCPFCKNKVQKPRVKNGSLASLFPEQVAAQWHSRNKIDPAKVSRGCSTQKYWWRCPKFEHHEWTAPPLGVTKSWARGFSGCPYCRFQREPGAGGIGVLADGTKPRNDLSAQLPAHVEMFWSERNTDHSPTTVTVQSTKLLWWQCPLHPEHEWQSRVAHVTRIWKSGYTGCPHCPKRQALEPLLSTL